MGIRTTILIDNDNVELLKQDPEIGSKIYRAIMEGGDFGTLGSAVEQSYTNSSRLVIIGKGGSFDIEVLATVPTLDDDCEVELIRQAADKFGYRLSKKTTK